MEFHHPTAPVQAVTSPVHGGETMTSWFDIKTWPIGLAEPEGPTGIEESVKGVHEQLDAIVAGGVPSQKILLGGFSQGGTVSILAGLTYPKPLAGIVSISGWGAYREGLAAKVHEANKATPMFYSVGTGDPIVTFPLTQKSGEILQSILGEQVTVNHAKRPQHPPGPTELSAAAQFMAAQLLSD
jgi:predicted esterase